MFAVVHAPVCELERGTEGGSVIITSYHNSGLQLTPTQENSGAMSTAAKNCAPLSEIPASVGVSDYDHNVTGSV